VQTNNTFKFVIVGGGTAGLIAASYLATAFKENTEIVLIYDHNNPGIGVGESLTPIFKQFLNDTKITQAELIKNVSATVKIGLKFKNWLNDGKSFCHGFNQFNSERWGIRAAYDIVNNNYDGDCLYSSEYFEKGIIPSPTIKSIHGNALHIDATLLSRFIENKFKDKITIIDDVVVDVVKSKNNIKEVILKNRGIVKGDFFIDASGFQCVLMKHMNNSWVDKSKQLPINRFIPNPVPTTHNDNIPPYTISEATDSGWILQVPLQHRWGTGYLYCSDFTTDEQAHDKFSIWSKENYNFKVTSHSVLKFKSGYWKDQWVGNCLVTGLASGFAEPLEATNIHHTITQLIKFCNIFNYTILEQDRVIYNNAQRELYENIYTYLGFCYTTGRTDSEFWKYMTNNIPGNIKQLLEKAENDYLNADCVDGVMFMYENFTCVASGLKKFNTNKIKDILIRKGLYNIGKNLSYKLRQDRLEQIKHSINHKSYIDSIVK